MKNKIYHFKKYEVELIVPKEIVLFIKAAKINTKEVFDKGRWKMEVEDNVFYSHEKHPSEEDYQSFGENPLSKSKHIKALIHGFYLTSKKIFELEPKDYVEKEPLCTSSVNLDSGWRIYFSFYE